VIGGRPLRSEEGNMTSEGVFNVNEGFLCIIDGF